MVTTVKTIGFIGLGNAGYHLAANLPRAGFNLVVRDADHSRAQTFIDENPNSIIAGENNENAWKEVEVLVTMLPNGEIVRDVLLGETGVARNLKAGKTYQLKQGHIRKQKNGKKDLDLS
jgi:3-hydroxyisobutyrate dehydrogenase-like beta-hydroxyacid dehydrogenase